MSRSSLWRSGRRSSAVESACLHCRAT